MILKSRHVALRVIPVAVVLLAGSAGFATVQASTISKASAAKSSVSPAVVGTSLYVSPFGTDAGPNNCQSAAAPCGTVQYAVSQDNDNGTINLAAGAYVEQVAITKSLSIVGAGQDESTIEAPASLVNNSQTPPQNAIVDLAGSGTNVSMSKLTVAGPGPTGASCGNDPSSLDKGIDVHNSATLNLSTAAVRNVYNQANQGCQRGDGISIGSAFFGAPNDVGHATLTGVKVSIYQKNGIAVRGPGSTLHMSGGSVTNNPSASIAANGIEDLSGAVAVVAGTTVTGNECNVTPPACGSNPLTDTMSDGVLVFQSGSGSAFTGMKVSGNDQGIYTDDGVTLSHDVSSNNRYNGIFVDADATHAVVSNDTANNDGPYGIITVSGSLNRFVNDTATGNTTFDLYAGKTDGTSQLPSDTNHYSGNHSTLAFPSKAYWHSS